MVVCNGHPCDVHVDRHSKPTATSQTLVVDLAILPLDYCNAELVGLLGHWVQRLYNIMMLLNSCNVDYCLM